jgi:copper amine oxidase-like protein
VRRTLCAILALIGLLAAAPTTIIINGDKLPIDPPPLMERNVLYVPVRHTLDALGLPFLSEGKRVTTQVGSRSVDVKPTIEIKNVLYVPLRFFSDVLGAQMHYDKRTNTVTMVAQLVGRTANGLTPTRSGFVRVGTVAAVDVLSNPPTITLGYDTGPKTVPIGPNAIIEMEDVGANVTTPGELGEIRPGDFARIEMGRKGSVERVIDAFGSHYGKIVAVGSGQFVLDDGQVVTAGRTTEVALNGNAAGFADLKPGDEVSVRYNVETNEVREVLASRKVAGAAGGDAHVITSVEDDANQPLRAGGAVHVTLHGTPGGSATFDIGSYVTNIAMQETQPGTYTGAYTIPRGANFSAVPVIGRLQLAGRAPVDAAAEQTVSAASTAPGISAVAPQPGTTVDASHPGIFAAFSAGAVPVNPSSALLWVNGRDVTSECVRTAQFIQYLPSYSYPNGPVRVTVKIADRAGNVTTKSWTFSIKTR